MQKKDFNKNLLFSQVHAINNILILFDQFVSKTLSTNTNDSDLKQRQTFFIPSKFHINRKNFYTFIVHSVYKKKSKFKCELFKTSLKTVKIKIFFHLKLAFFLQYLCHYSQMNAQHTHIF